MWENDYASKLDQSNSSRASLVTLKKSTSDIIYHEKLSYRKVLSLPIKT